MTTTHLDIDYQTLDIDVVSDAVDLDIEVATPALDLGVPGLTGPQGKTGHQMVWVMFGPVVPKIGTVGFYPRIPGTITRVTAAVSQQASGTTRPNIKISGTTVFTNPANRPTLNGVGRHYDDADAVDAGAFTATDYLTCDVDTVGTGTEDLIVTVEYV